ncbi:hypothetical protein MUP77_02160 [Candidatus Bathyarchaeota archaeon]|nr:hypothetical protein [Candidatus Bathyarchaeota archaeon]
MAQEKESVQKLQLDNLSDFKFHVAYMAYSEAWDENLSEGTRTEINQLISSLSSGKADYNEFYANLSKFRKQQVELHRERIQGQRKRDWRRSEKKDARNARHKTK